MAQIHCPGKGAWPELLGKKGEVAKRVIEKENHLVKGILVKNGNFVTHDYRCDRVWIWVNDAGFVFKVPHIG